MEFTSQIVPAVITLFASLMSGTRASVRWETVTAIFGWTATISLLLIVFSWPFHFAESARPYLTQVFAFSMLTALGRDYEKILAPLFKWNR